MAGFDFQDLLNALIAQESRGNPSAVSKRGAVGLMQIMPQHAGDLYGKSAPSVFDEGRARGFGVPDESTATARGLLMDPEISMALGEPYLRDLLRAFGGNIDQALTAYNAGPVAMRNMVDAGKGPADFASDEAKNYAGKVREQYSTEVGQELPQIMDVRQLVRPKPRPVGLLGM